MSNFASAFLDIRVPVSRRAQRIAEKCVFRRPPPGEMGQLRTILTTASVGANLFGLTV